MLARDEILAAAKDNGWTVYRDLDQDRVGSVEIRRIIRRGGRQRTEYIRIRDDSLGRLTDVVWSPGLDGFNARHALRDKKAWALEKIRSVGPR